MKKLSILLVSLMVSLGVVAEPTPPAAEQGTDVSTLVTMIRKRPLNLAEIRPLLGATFSGDSVRLSSMRVAPLEPNTLVDSFDIWRFAARLQLLMDYATLQLAQKQPRSYGGPHAEKQRRLDVSSDRRIAILVREAGYEEAWQPFTAVYVKLHQEVSDKAWAHREKTGDADPFEMMAAIDVDGIARSHLAGVIEDYPIDPQIVAHEMLRQLEMTRTMLGVDSSETLKQHLFYACGTGKDSKVVTNTGHPLAIVLSAAYEADGKDAAAQKIKKSYRKLSKAYDAWAAAHSTASLEDQQAQVRELTEKIRLAQQLENYRAAQSSAGNGTRSK